MTNSATLTTITGHQLTGNTPNVIGADPAIYIAPARFDVHVIASLSRWADEALATGHDLVIDLRMVDFIDQAMITTLAEITERSARDGRTATVRELSTAAALTFELINRVAA